MPDYKIIASDLDGTLLRGDMTVSEKNLSAMNELCEMGITLALTSGRTLYEIPEEVRENKNIRYITYSNGTAVYDKELGRDIISNRISKESVNAVFDGEDIRISCVLSADASAFLNPEYVIKALKNECGILSSGDLLAEYYSVMREAAFCEDMSEFR